MPETTADSKVKLTAPTMSCLPQLRSVTLSDTERRARRFVDNVPVVLTTLALLVPVSTVTVASDAAPYAATLSRHRIEPDAEGLGEYLRQLHPDRQQSRKMLQLVEQLGSQRFSDRESAMRQLMAAPIPPIQALRIAVQSGDLEVRHRAREVLALDTSRRPMLMYAVFKTIELEGISGLTADLLRTMNLCDQTHLRLAARAAARASARPDDVSLLRRATTDRDKEVVVAAIGGLVAVLGSRAGGDLRRLMDHKADEVSLAATQALADQGDRTALQTLVRLLNATSLQVRIGAAWTLREVSHKQHGYSAYGDALSRKEAISRWNKWVSNEGLTATLHFPLMRVRPEFGRTLITIAAQNRVIELDGRGNEVWRKTGLANTWGCMGLPNGHRLITSRDGRYTVEYDPSGKEIWRKDGLPEAPINVQRLENGNTLIAFFVAQKVIEIRPDGSAAWEITIKGGPVDVQRLDGGRTLVTLHQPKGRVVEVDRAGGIYWDIRNLMRPMTAQRLENGNTLISEYGADRVAEWNRSGEIVWQSKGLRRPYSAERLTGGSTLIAHETDVREVDRLGEVIWLKQLTGARHATRY